IVDGTELGLGEAVAAALRVVPPGAEADSADRTVFRAEIEALAGRDAAAVRTELEARVGARALDGFLWLPAGVMAGEPAHYEGRNATNFSEVREIGTAVQRAVQAVRLRETGIEPQMLAD